MMIDGRGGSFSSRSCFSLQLGFRNLFRHLRSGLLARSYSLINSSRSTVS